MHNIKFNLMIRKFVEIRKYLKKNFFTDAMIPVCQRSGNLTSPIPGDTCDNRAKRCQETFNEECCNAFLRACLVSEELR